MTVQSCMATKQDSSAKKTIAANLPVLREICGRLGQLELAQQVSVSRRTIARLEAGEVADPGVEQLQRIASALGVTLEMLAEQSLVAVTIPVPKHVRDRLASKDGAKVLERMVDAAG